MPARNPRIPNPGSGRSSKADGSTARLAAFLDACGGEVRRAGDEHVFRCPCHERHANGDANPSGSVRVGDDGRLLVTCRAHCATEDMVAAIDWTMADLMPLASSDAGRPTKSATKAKKVYPDLEAIAAAAARTKKGTHESTHIYKDINGEPVFAVVRVRHTDGKKDILQVRPQSDGWVFGGVGKNRPLYRLPDLLAAPTDVPIHILEGEQKADLMARLGFVATSTSQGAGSAHLTDFVPVRDRIVLLYADADDAGHDHMQQVAQHAHAAGATNVTLVSLPGLPPKGDIVDFSDARHEAGATDEDIADEIRDAIARAIDIPPEPRESNGDADDSETGTQDNLRGESIADQVVAMAGDATLFHDDQGETYATFQVNDHRETWRIGSNQFSRWLANRFFQAHRIAVPPQAMTTAIGQLEAMALFQGDLHAVHMRTARTATAVWVDLCNHRWQAVEITANGWRIVDEPPVRFIRRSGMKPLPTPEAGFTSLDPLFDLLHIESPDIRLLVTAWLVNAIIASSSYPILSLTGEQGSGKSTFCRATQRLVDPHQVEGRSPPRNEEDIAVAAQHAHLLVYENLSYISQQISDALCRVSTGAAFAARKLYTDSEERQLVFCRPVVINGIGDLATRSDLADRVVSVHLEPIPRDRRQTEAALWLQYEAMHPRLFGTLLDLVVRVLGAADLDVPLERMAEYSQLGAKVAGALGLPAETFVEAYKTNRDNSSVTALESSAIGPALLRMLRKQAVKCPIGALLHELVQTATTHEQRHPEWPRHPRALGNELRRLSPNLGRIGFTVLFPPRRPDGYWVEIAATPATDVHDVHDLHRAPTTD